VASALRSCSAEPRGSAVGRWIVVLGIAMGLQNPTATLAVLDLTATVLTLTPYGSRRTDRRVARDPRQATACSGSDAGRGLAALSRHLQMVAPLLLARVIALLVALSARVLGAAPHRGGCLVPANQVNPMCMPAKCDTMNTASAPGVWASDRRSARRLPVVHPGPPPAGPCRRIAFANGRSRIPASARGPSDVSSAADNRCPPGLACHASCPIPSQRLRRRPAIYPVSTRSWRSRLPGSGAARSR
jgi:hypothetical protein